MTTDYANLVVWNGDPTTTTNLVYYGPNPYTTTVPWVNIPATTVVWGTAQEKTIQEKVRELREDIKRYEDALDELIGLANDLRDLVNRRRRPDSSEDTQDGMKS